MPSTNSRLQRLNLKPGFHRESTQYSEEGKWFDGDRVRFREGKPENLRGYQKFIDTSFIGTARDLLAWTNNNTEKLLGYGTESKLYVVYNDYPYDVTPIVSTVSIGNLGTTGSFDTVAGSPLIEVSSNNNGRKVGDYVEFSNTSINGFTTNGLDFSASSFGGPTFEVVSVQGINNFFISVTSVAASTESNQGSGIAFFLLATGQSNPIQGLGYGAGIYNAGVSTTGERAWNQPAESSNIIFLGTQWSLDNFGEDLLAARQGGNLIHWDANASLAPVRSSVVGTAPSKINSIVISPNDRHVIALGTEEFATSVFNPLLVRWSDQEDYANWIPSVSSTSGELQLIDGTRIVGGVRGRNAILVYTDNALYTLQFVGPPFIFRMAQVGTNCGLIGSHAAIDVGGRTYWMGDTDFFMFDGSVKKLDCTIRRYLYDDFNMTQKSKVFAGLNSEFHEIIWLYPKSGSNEPDGYVIYNYMENTWVYGSNFYTTFIDDSVFLNTVATGAVTGNVSATNPQFIWYNEPTSVFSGDSQPLTSFIETADIDIGDGDDIMFIDKIIPDYTINTGTIKFSINIKDYPAGTTKEVGPFDITDATQKIDMRARGRQANFRVSTSDLNTSWKWGSVRVAIQPAGKR